MSHFTTRSHLTGLALKLSLVCLLVFLPFSKSLANWPIVYGGAGTQRVLGSTSDQDGNSITWGRYQSEDMVIPRENGLEPIILPAGELPFGFLVKRSGSGDAVWAKRISEVIFFWGDVKVDAENNIYVSGSIGNDATWAGTALSNGDGFIAKFDESGNVVWVKGFQQPVIRMSVAPDGGLFIAATDTVATTVYGLSATDGGQLWARNLSVSGQNGTSQFFSESVAVTEYESTTKTRHVYVLASVSDQVQSVCGNSFANGPLGSFGSLETYLAKVTVTGNLSDGYTSSCVWARRLNDDDAGSTDPNVRYGTSVVTDGTSLFVGASKDVGLARYSALNGERLSLKPATSTAYLMDRLEIDQGGNVYVLGSFFGSDFSLEGLDPVTSGTTNTYFAAKLGADQAWDWIKAIPRDNKFSGPIARISLNASETSLFITINISGTVSFDGENLSSNSLNARDIFEAPIDAASGKWLIPQDVVLGGSVVPPEGALLEAPSVYINGELDSNASDYTFWSAANSTLYIIGEPPGLLTLTWRTSTELDPANPNRFTTSVTVQPVLPADELIQTHIAGTSVNLEPAYDINDPNQALRFARVAYPPNSDSLVADGVFDRDAPVGSEPKFVVLQYVRTNSPDEVVDIATQIPVFQTVYTRAWDDPAVLQTSNSCSLGVELTSVQHEAPFRNGHLVFEKARYDAALHNRNTGIGPIFPVNFSNAPDNTMAVVWYGENSMGQYWGNSPVRYSCSVGFGNFGPIIVGNRLGSGELPANYTKPTIYNQPDPNLPGFNPNEEHAFLANNTVYALHEDLNRIIELNNPAYASPELVLLKYFDSATNKWAFERFIVWPEQVTPYQTTAGNLVPLPTELAPLGVCEESVLTDPNDAGWEDYKGNIWARSAGTVTAQYFYPLRSDFFYDLDGDGTADQEPGTCVPWTTGVFFDPDRLRRPIDVTYQFQWPAVVPVVSPGETIFASKEVPCSAPSADPCFMPQINGQAAAQIVYDETTEAGIGGPADSLVKLIDPISSRSVNLESLNGQISTESRGGISYFSDLPFVIRSRLSFDPINKTLSFGGWFDDSQIGDPHLLPNIMTSRERDRILALQGADQPFIDAINALYQLTRNPTGLDLDDDALTDDAYLVGVQPEVLGVGIDTNGDGVADDFADADGNRRDDRLDDPDYSLSPSSFLVQAVDPTTSEPQALLGTPMALTAGRPTGEGYVTIAFNNDSSLGSLPVSLEVFRMDSSNGVYQGNIWVVPSDNIFEEALTLRHTADFAGDPDLIQFEWYYQPDTSGQPDSPPVPGSPSTPWILHPSSSIPGSLDITIEGPGLLTLSDNWFITRYSNLGGSEYGNDVTPSPWAGDPSYDPNAPTSDPNVQAKAMLATGWIKRVIAGLNPFDQRVSDFRSSEVNTITSMISQAGEPYVGPIPFNPDPEVVNSVGLIEAYQTVLNQGKDLSINAGFDDIAANTQLLNVATRIADLYMLLANEAYADAQDPTIGFSTDGELGSAASSLFAFQNQLQSPLEEELVLLRGRDSSRAGVSGYPVNNRLFWNFTQGNGEVAYVQNYGITDQNKDGFITETDARALYPQGHGDAWGHYLSSVKTRYLLLREPNFTWKPRAESVLVAGVPIEVDYLDERKFAAAAAAKARAGTEIINLTYREKYVEDPAGQWQGYKDTSDNSDRAWGLDGWGRRTGQGAYFDWLTANAILPAEDTVNQGIEKVDRTTVVELSQIVDQYAAVQSQMDQADAGLNPLGLAKGVVPFDIDPNFLEVGSGNQGENHFDQISDRAKVALNNALEVFDYANQQTQSLRSLQDQADQLNILVLQQERDYRNRLIEIFGYPYAGDIGGGKTYPSGYNGPDLYHYMYVSTELTGDLPPPDGSFTGFFSEIPFGGEQGFVFPADLGAAYENVSDTLEVDYPVARGADWEFIAPASWGKRRAPGKLQNALSEVLQAQAQLQRAATEHQNLLKEVTDAADLVKAEYQLNLDEISILQTKADQTYSLNAAMVAAKAANLAASTTSEAISDAADAAEEGIPKVVGVATDAFSTARTAVKIGDIAATTPFNIAASVAEIAEYTLDIGKGAVELQTDIKLAQDTTNVALVDRIKELEQLWREEAVLRLELFTQAEVVNQTLGSYYETLAEGQRLLEERRAFRIFTAGDVQENRYSDLTFRIFRNDALQKYRAQFDLAARYVYLAAAAYDYETNLLGDDAGSGRKFLADIVRQRSIGQLIDGEPVAGTPGLADVLARLNQNFAVYRGQLGFNNPQVESNRFSLRYELFRKRIDPTDPTSELSRLETEEEWRQKLEESRVENLWTIPEFKRFARPFTDESLGPQPGLVIRFSTTVNFGLNFFGYPLGAGDSAYDPTNFATKIRAVGTWFEGYNDTGLSNTPRVYLLPVGMDVMRSPTGDTLATREWRVVDQKLPAPFPVGASDLSNPDWIPANDSLSDTYGDIRRFSSYRAYHDSGEYVASESASDTRLIGRSVWNTDWMLVIPGGTLYFDPDEGLNRLIQGQEVSVGQRDGNGITDIKLHFQTYGFSGN